MTDLRPYLAKQFVFVRDGKCPPWLEHFALGLETSAGTLFVGPNMPVTPVGDPEQPLGFWLGWPIVPDGQAVPQPASDSDIEDYIYAHSGSFIYVDLAGGDARFYLDACGSLSLVHDRRSGTVASTAWVALGPDGYAERFLPERLQDYNVAGHGWTTGGDTAHEDVVRVMANHLLEAATGAISRHWPSDWPTVDGQDEVHLDAIADECAAVMRSAMASGQCMMTLTAGNESRLLAACLGEDLTRPVYVTVVADPASMDCVVSQKLATRFGLDWRQLPVVEATPEQVERWHLTVGHTLTGANVRQHPTIDQLGRHILIGGLGGEIGRAFLWRNDFSNSQPPTSAELAKRLKLPRSPRVDTVLQRWLDELPAGLDPIAIYELAYIELRMSCWAYAQSYTNPDMIQIAPLISRACFTHMLRLTPEVRRSQSFARLIVMRRQPALLEIPINRFGDMRDWWSGLAKIRRFVRTRLLRG